MACGRRILCFPPQQKSTSLNYSMLAGGRRGKGQSGWARQTSQPASILRCGFETVKCTTNPNYCCQIRVAVPARELHQERSYGFDRNRDVKMEEDRLTRGILLRSSLRPFFTVPAVFHIDKILDWTVEQKIYNIFFSPSTRWSYKPTQSRNNILPWRNEEYNEPSHHGW